MKQIFVALLLFFFSVSPTFAQAGWVITDFHSDITVDSTGSVLIKESINVDFNNLDKHGIYRDIPVVYQDDAENKTYTNVEIISVTQDNQKAEYKRIDNENNLRIRVGDPDKTISGKHSYLLTYKATGVLRSFADYDQFYWNVTGNEWEAPIERASANVTLPKDGIKKITCFQGYVGDTTSCVSSAPSPASAIFASDRPYNPTEGLTIVVDYTKGMVPILTIAPPKKITDDIFSATSFISFFLALACGIVGMLWVWMKNGRDLWFRTRRQMDPNAKEELMPLSVNEPVVVEFEPPEKLRPAELGVLMDEKADTLDITATIIDLANRGFLTIKEIEKKWLFGSKDYEMHRTKMAADKLLSYEKLLLDRLFVSGDIIKMSSLKMTFYNDLAEVKKKLYEDVMKKNFFVENPESKRNAYVGIGVGVSVLGGILMYFGFHFVIASLVSFGAGTILIGIILLFISQTMPRRSAYGRELYQRVKGYELFISSAEKYRQQFFEKKNMFNEILPYAIIFGLTGKFAQAMKDMGVTPKNPTWYSGTHTFTPTVFASDVNSFSKSLSSAIAATPSSSGSSGGSSGGGFGGGGGGSW